jgi:hypothetical protein
MDGETIIRIRLEEKQNAATERKREREIERSMLLISGFSQIIVK